MNTVKRYMVTSALPYANGPLHVGHLSGAYLSGDVFARYLRLMGKDVLYVCGSDEHGAAITIRAMKEGLTPREIIDKYDTMFRAVFQKMGISFDIFHRTSAELHHKTSQDFFMTLYNKGEFIEQKSEQYYDETAKQFLADRYIMGICPKCANPDAYGDQCEKCGTALSPTELGNPRSTLSGATPVKRETTHWYLPLDKYENWLRTWIKTGELDGKVLHDPSAWKAHVLGQCNSWLDSGLQPRAMTRDLDWGIDVPKEVPHSEGKKLYVWLDAPIGYISATKQLSIDKGKPDLWKKYWQDKDSALIHFIGKDNIVFHCLIFPAMLKVHGKYVLPKNVPANQFMNLEGKKISTSRNWAVWVHEYIEDFAGKEDVLRYYLIKNMPEQRDSEFTWKGFQEANDTELVGNLANFIHRVMVLTNKYYNGIVPKPDIYANIIGHEQKSSDYDSELVALHDHLQDLSEHLRNFNNREALTTLMLISTMGNQILQFNEPWKMQKSDPETVRTVLNLALQIVTAISVACRPFLPFTSDKLREMLNLPKIQEKGEWKKLLDALSEGKSILKTKHQIGEPHHLFTKIPDEVIAAQVQKLADAEKINTPPPTITYTPVKETINFDDFAKIDIRTATILEATKVPKADKLLKLTVDLGFEQRTIVSGIAEHFKPENLAGQACLVLVNLAPRTLRGIESNGMILMAENSEGKLSFVTPETGWGSGFGVK
jgi:methionyl-tRNA synthetase